MNQTNKRDVVIRLGRVTGLVVLIVGLTLPTFAQKGISDHLTQSLIRFPKENHSLPPVVYLHSTDSAWMIFDDGEYYFVYVREGSTVTIFYNDDDYTIGPILGGQIWQLDLNRFEQIADTVIMPQPDPAPIPVTPLKIEAENFTLQNSVVIENGGTGKIVGFFNTGDRLEYELNLTGYEQIEFRYANAISDDRTLIVEVDGNPVASFTSYNTGGWLTFDNVSIPFAMGPINTGAKLTLRVDGDLCTSCYWGNLDYFILR